VTIGLAERANFAGNETNAIQHPMRETFAMGVLVAVGYFLSGNRDCPHKRPAVLLENSPNRHLRHLDVAFLFFLLSAGETPGVGGKKGE
jgi:hypothetical protein